MKIFKKQIPVRHILYVVLGWLHATMLCVPLYAVSYTHLTLPTT